MSPVTVVVVAVSTCAVLTALLRFAPRPGRAQTGWLVPLALALGVAALFLTQESLPTLPHRQRWHSILWLAIALGIGGSTLAVALDARRRATSLRLPAIAALCGGTTLLVLVLPSAGTAQPAHVAALGAIALAWTFAPLAERDRGFATPFATSLCAIALAGLILESGFAKGAVTAGGLAAALGAVALASLPLWRGRSAGGLGLLGGAVAITLLAALAALGRAYSDDARPSVPHLAWIVPPVAPLGVWLGGLPGCQRRPRLAATLRAIGPLVLLCLGLAAAFAGQGPPLAADEDPYGAYP